MKFLKLEKRKNIAYVTFIRNESLNALNRDTLIELVKLNEKIVVVYRSDGAHFSAGADIKEKHNKLTDLETWKTNLGKDAIESILKLNQITIASIKGFCLGGAACIASACDFRVASKSIKLAYPEIDLGMNLNWFGLPLLLRLIGPSKTKKMVIGGEIENAKNLFEWGFIDEICDEEDLEKTTKKIASKYASKPLIPAQMIKKSVNALVYQNDQSIMHMDYDQFLLTRELGKKD
jgi:enoyl-CoA hydratase/carnithine racemase